MKFISPMAFLLLSFSAQAQPAVSLQELQSHSSKIRDKLDRRESSQPASQQKDEGEEFSPSRLLMEQIEFSHEVVQLRIQF